MSTAVIYNTNRNNNRNMDPSQKPLKSNANNGTVSTTIVSHQNQAHVSNNHTDAFKLKKLKSNLKTKYGIEVDDDEFDPRQEGYDENPEEEEEEGLENFEEEQPSLNAMDLASFKRFAIDVIQEYFISCDIDEVRNSLIEANCPMYHYDLVKRSISMSLDKNSQEKELVSRLLSELYPNFFTRNDIEKGIECLLKTKDDLLLDIPNGEKEIGTFIARGVQDEIIAPSFLVSCQNQNLGGEIIDYSKLLLSREHMGARLEKIWGPGDGRKTNELKVSIDLLLEEYLLSENYEEAKVCVKELNCPFYYHEVVKRAINLSLDKGEEDRLKVSALFNHLFKEEVVSAEQFKKGFNRIFALVPELVLDIPLALKYLDEFTSRAKEFGILEEDYMYHG